MEPKCTRKNSRHIKVYCLPDEYAQVSACAAAARRSLSRYLLDVGLGYAAPSLLDQRRVDAMLRVNADLGRLGGLLKLWLTNDERTAAFGEATIRGLLDKIEATRDELVAVIRSVVEPRAGDGL